MNANTSHRLVRVIHDVGGWSGECSCRKWAGTARTKPGLAAKHYGHVQEQIGRKR